MAEARWVCSDQGYALDCPCGWRGVLWSTAEGARREFSEHVQSLVLRGPGGPYGPRYCQDDVAELLDRAAGVTDG